MTKIQKTQLRTALKSASLSASNKSPSAPFARRSAKRKKRPSASAKKPKKSARRRKKKRKRKMLLPQCPWVSVVPLNAIKTARERLVLELKFFSFLNND